MSIPKWKSFKLWQKLSLFVAPFAMGGEVYLALNHSHIVWHVIIVSATIISVYATKVFTDVDGNGIVDQFQ